VCDLQGVFNVSANDLVFELTDPVIHYTSNTGREKVFGRTDKGKGRPVREIISLYPEPNHFHRKHVSTICTLDVAIIAETQLVGDSDVNGWFIFFHPWQEGQEP